MRFRNVCRICLFVVLLTMLIGSNIRIRQLQAENDYMFGAYWQCYNAMQLRIEQLKLNQAYLENQRNEVLGLYMPEHTGVEAE